ncbi:MAG: ABC transporter ATP-binding protein [Candidatus Rokubacteria bacterium]|nr:ABC transporter ATP-binding protein [Candidatus Rokubacteria bacterium]
MGGAWAIRGFRLRVEPGELLVLLGPPGAGKTTALRALAGLLAPEEGEARLDGAPIAALAPSKRGIAVVFQGLALWPHLTAFEHLALGLRARGEASGDVSWRVAETLEAFGLEALAGRRPGHLDADQRLRLALARALVVRPRVLLLDEPLAGLAGELRAVLRAELKRLYRERGIPFVHATRDAEDAMALASRLALVEGGRVVQVGAPLEVYRRPRTRGAAEITGALNALHGVMGSGPGGRQVRLRDGLRLLVGPTDARDGWEVTCVVRPESVQLGAMEARGVNRFLATVADVAWAPGRWTCHVLLPGEVVLRVDLPPTAAPPKPGEQVSVLLPAEDVIVLE